MKSAMAESVVAHGRRLAKATRRTFCPALEVIYEMTSKYS